MHDQGAPIITSSSNSVIKRARSLLRRKGRYEERAFLVEGARAVFDAFAAGCTVEVVLLRADPGMRDLGGRLPAGVSTRSVEPRVFDGISDVIHSQGILAIVSMDALPHSRPKPDVVPLLLVVDAVLDPGNLGTLLRSAAGGGVSEVLVTPETVDPFNPKCVRAAMGAHFRIPLVGASVEEVSHRVRTTPTVALADAGGSVDYAEVDWTGPGTIIVGGEAAGASEAIRSCATVTVRIPLSGGVESLNAGVAGSLLIFEAARQRRHA